jgi:hypothetical protein
MHNTFHVTVRGQEAFEKAFVVLDPFISDVYCFPQCWTFYFKQHFRFMVKVLESQRAY